MLDAQVGRTSNTHMHDSALPSLARYNGYDQVLYEGELYIKKSSHP